MDLTEELEKLIEKRASEKVAKIKGNVEEYKEWIEGLDETIAYLEKDAKEIVEDNKKEGLTINAIEGEGFLRGILTLKNQIVADKQWI